ncbi:MAG TPA: SdrD B-like domain-containing protein, partial [Burkholderiaceae bacterium]
MSANLSFAPVSPGFAYARVTDPSQGAKMPMQVVRSDGYIVPAENVWLSKVRNDDLTWSYFLNIFDANTTGQYMLSFTSGGSTASIEGVVYDDHNANGLHDAGEAGIPVLEIKLTGTQSDTGSAVLASTYTDSHGLFKFIALKPGTYTLTAATLDGQLDGPALAGNAGGASVPGKFSGIALVAGASASGYVFSKQASKPVTATPDPVADLSVTIGATPALIDKTSTSTVTVTAKNSGPATAGQVAANLDVPAGLAVVSHSAGAGSYANGQWSLGDMGVNASATLTLQVRLAAGASAKEFTLTARIGSATMDETVSNNSASAVIKLKDEPTLSADQRIDQGMRVLALVGCADATCLSSKQQAAQAALEQAGAQAHVVTTVEAFRQELRAGDFSMLLLSGPDEGLNAQLQEEVRAAAYRGSTLIIDGAPGTALRALADTWGGNYSDTTLPPPVAVQTGTDTFNLNGSAWAITPGVGGNVLASYASGQAAIIKSSYGKGQAYALGFDPWQEGLNAASWTAWMTARLTEAVPSVTEPMLAQTKVRLRTIVQNSGTDTAQAELATTLADGMQQAASSPVATQTANIFTWPLTLA